MGYDTTISVNLRQLLKMRDELSLSELARQTQIPQPTLHHLLHGATKNPRRKVLEKLANFFSVSIPQLTGILPLNQTIPDTIKKNLNLTVIPILNWDLVGSWPYIDRASTQLTEIILDRQADSHSFALTVENTNREPLFPENSLLIFDPAKKPQDRDFVIVQLGQNNALLFNRLFVEKSELFVKQDQPDGNMSLIKIRKNIDKIIGTLIEVRLKF